jgi:hypothetical protein
MFSENRFDGAQNTQEVVVPVEKKETRTELQLRQREEELKKRYEDPYRSFQAQELLKSRQSLKNEEAKRVETLQKNLESNISSASRLIDNERYSIDKENEVLSYKLEAAQAEKQRLESLREGRGFFQKLKYRFTEDPLIGAITTIANTQEEYQKTVGVNDQKVEEIQKKWGEYGTKNNVLLGEMAELAKVEYSDKKKSLLEKVKKVNKSSREAIRNTLLSMEQGELDIAKLARENNALVVHAIPLDGWSIKNTSMNNKEVDVEAMNVKEKYEILTSKQPDVSASILSANGVIEGQDMFYPFGFIIDGTLVAAYKGDEGTYADGDTRRRKEMYHGTLHSDLGARFAKLTQSAAKTSQGGQYNESIVHRPVPKGIIIDENKLLEREDLGDTVKEFFSQDEEDAVVAKYGVRIISTAKGTPTSGPYAGKSTFRIERRRTATEKALEYASQNHPELPVYLRRRDGIYTQDGKKVTAEDIYS